MMNLNKWVDWRIKALNEIGEEKKESFKCPKCGRDLKPDQKTGTSKCSCGWKEVEPEWESAVQEHHGGEYPPELLNMNVSQFLDWLKAKNVALYNAVEKTIESGEVPKESLEESFYHLTSEAKIGYMIREMKKSLSFIEKKFSHENELAEVNEKQLENWVRTYKSLKELDERMHNLMKSMRGK